MRPLKLGLCITMAVTLGYSAPIIAADSDNDGIPDEVERQLGTDPLFAEPLQLICGDRARNDGDRSVSTDNYSAERDVTQVFFAPVAKGRYLWRIDFAGPYTRQNSILILYLNADNDTQTGRKDTPDGWDYMLTLSGPQHSARYINAAGESSAYRAPLVAVVGNSVYMCADLPLRQANGKSVYGASVLSETLNPHKFVDSTGTFAVSAAGESTRERIVTPLDLEQSQGIRVSQGLDLIRKLGEDPANVVIPIETCRFEGFERDLRSEYRDDSARRTGEVGSITATVPKGGRWHPAVIFYDGGGDERFIFKVNGEQKGVLVANVDDNRQRLFALEETIDLKQGDALTLEMVSPTGTYRTEDLLLLAELPPAWTRTFEITEVAATIPWDTDGSQAEVTWITNWCTQGKVEYGPTAAYGSETSEARALNNHRVWLAGLRPGQTYHYRIACPRPDGTLVYSPDSKFIAGPRAIPRGTAQQEALPVSIVCQGALAAGAWPVTQGIPLPAGALGSPDNARLLDAAGKEVPCQVTVTGRWPDGTIKWLLVDFDVALSDAKVAPADTAHPEPIAQYVLEFGVNVRRSPHPAPVIVSQTEDSVTVDTGPTRFELGRKRFGPFERVWVGGRLVSQADEQGGLRLVDAAGKEYASLAPVDVLEVEEAGPHRAGVKVGGRCRAADGEQLFAYEARLQFYAGKPFVRAHVAFANDRTEQKWTLLRSLCLRVPVLGMPDSPALTSLAAAPQPLPVALRQLDDSLLELQLGDTKRRSKDRTNEPLWVTVQDCMVGAAVRDFWQHYPKSLGADRNGIEIGLCPQLDPTLYPAEGTDSHRVYYYLQNGLYKLKWGVSKRHELMLCFAPPGTAFDAMAQYLQNPPLAVCDPKWYCSTKVFGDLPGPDQKAMPLYDPCANKAMLGYLANREKNREYGMMNFGDWWGEREINWGNIEYDTQHAFLIHWARTGDLRFFFCGEQAARHHMDVDMIRFNPNPDLVGCVYAHCIGHVGDYYDKSPEAGKGIPGGGVTVSHTWTEGLCDYYFLTGDRRSMESAKLIADRFDTVETRNYDFTNCRNPGWHLILTMGLYRAAYDPYYLNAAKIIVDRVIERQTPDGGWRRQLVPGHCYCTPQHHGNAGFMVAVLLTGLRAYHEATGDQRIPEVMRRGARFLIDDMWVEEVQGFRYTSCPKSSAGTWSNFMIFDGALYAARVTGDKVIPAYARKGMARALENGISGFGKSISQQMCDLPRVIYEMERLDTAGL